MSKRTIITCNQCGKESAEEDARFWHFLQLVYPDAGFIPARQDTHRYDMCSRDCLRAFVQGLRGERTPHNEVSNQ